MKESKINLTHRLRREGRWDEASRFKDDWIAQLRSKGKPRKEAQQAAWEAMERRFPPQETAESASTVQEELDTELKELTDLASPSFLADAGWVYQRLSVKGVKPEDAPSPGAWALLQWAKLNQNRFFEHVMPKVVSSKKKMAMEASEELPEELKFDTSEIERMLEDHQLQRERQAVENIPRAVQDKVKSRLSDWERRFRLRLTDEARESWLLQMTRLAGDVLQAVQKHPELYRTHQEEEFFETRVS